MHLFARWQHQEVDMNLIGYTASYTGEGCTNGCKIKQSFEDWNLFQLGGIIFF
jgi:hypothetical protein